MQHYEAQFVLRHRDLAAVLRGAPTGVGIHLHADDIAPRRHAPLGVLRSGRQPQMDHGKHEQ